MGELIKTVVHRIDPVCFSVHCSDSYACTPFKNKKWLLCISLGSMTGQLWVELQRFRSSTS